MNATDDILITADTEEELEKRFREVLSRLERHGLTCKLRKCAYNEPKVTFFGLKLSEKIASLSDQKTEALKKLQSPGK